MNRFSISYRMPASKKPYFSIRSSATHGHGAFAVRKIRRGTRIVEYQGKRTSWKKALKRPPSDPNDPYHTFIFGLDNGKVIDASLDGNDARWINHSCDPNCEAIEEEDGGVFIYAMRTIQPGEELNYDYRLSVDGKPSKKERKRYACHCGSENCRGTMLDV